MRHKPFYRLCAGVLALGLASLCSPTAMAADLAPDVHGLIHAYYCSYDGQEPHILAVNQPCSGSDPRLSWNILGRQPLRSAGAARSSRPRRHIPFLAVLAFAVVDEHRRQGGNGGTGGKAGAGGVGGAGSAGATGGSGGYGRTGSPWQ